MKHTDALVLPVSRSRASDYVALAKPRLNLLVVITTAVGFYLGTRNEINLLMFFHTVVGTALVAGGSAAMNQIYERRVDALMNRTKRRPLPDGRLSVMEAGVFALVLSVVGLLQLAIGANFLAAMVALMTLVTYVAVYTPLKLKTSFATVVGAVPGALPPMIGWAAATGVLSREAWVLFAIVFLWQMPHFLAIAWLYRDEYARAGFPLLPVVEPDGRSTARQVTAYAAALLPVSLAPTALGLATDTFFIGALVLGSVFLGLAVAFARAQTRDRARWLFLGSILYLPLVWGLLVATRALP
ncbi:MAG: heme o synthase [Acidobacteria bacterium]|nr:heme o synthase [Acidobacteriota bacterium]